MRPAVGKMSRLPGSLHATDWQAPEKRTPESAKVMTRYLARRLDSLGYLHTIA